jgi:hypothetical protein
VAGIGGPLPIATASAPSLAAAAVTGSASTGSGPAAAAKPARITTLFPVSAYDVVSSSAAVTVAPSEPQPAQEAASNGGRPSVTVPVSEGSAVPPSPSWCWRRVAANVVSLSVTANSRAPGGAAVGSVPVTVPE